MKKFYSFVLAVSLLTGTLTAQTYHNLSGGTFTQNWNNISLITANDDWTGIPSIIGYLGNNGNITTGHDPQTAVSAGYSDTLDVIANQTDPNTQTAGGVAEFEIEAGPTIALQGSGTADAPNIVIYINATGINGIRVKYLLRDIDGSADNSVQPVALQYRIGNTGDFINIPDAFVADASGDAPSQATKTTQVNVLLPSACNNQAELQIRIITNNAVGSDEWIGVDDIEVSQDVASSVRNIIRDDNFVRIGGNPAISSDVFVQFSKPVSGEVTMQLMDMNGQILLQRRVVRPVQGQTETLSLQHLPRGTYILSMISKEGRYSTKLIR